MIEELNELLSGVALDGDATLPGDLLTLCDTDYAREEALRAQLGGKEQLLWTGQPRGGGRLRSADSMLVPLSLLACTVAIRWELSVLTHGVPRLFALGGIPLLLIGLYVLVSRFWLDARARARTYYALTDQRALIISDLRRQKTRSLLLRTLGGFTVAERSDGSGTITLAPPAGHHSWFSEPPAFEMIDDVRRVGILLRDAQWRANARAA